MIGLIDYGMGNLRSVYHALEMVGSDVQLCGRPEDLADVEKVVLPGVGAFGRCMDNLRSRGWVEALEEAVHQEGKPILGICLGMQVMATRGFEFGEHVGLGWFDADVVRLTPEDTALRVPHIGWNGTLYDPSNPLFKQLPKNPDFYFVHSYHFRCHEEADVAATCEYGGPFTAAVRKGHVFGTQFHPEKSQEYGLRVLENFARWKPHA